MAVRTVWTGDAPAQVPHYYGTFSEIVAITGPNGAIGHPTDSKELLEYEDGEWGSIGVTSKFPPAPGTPSNPFPDAAALPAAGRFVGDETCMTYSLAPLGYVRWYWSGARWKLSSDQVIVNYENDDGSPIFDQTAALLTPGTAYDIWMSDILPTWLLTAGFRGALALEAAFSDASSTLNVTMRATLGDTLISGTDASNGLVGITSAASTSSKEFSMTPVNFRVQSGGIFAVAGSSPFGQGQPGPRDQAQTVLSPRIRLNIVPGAVTNRFRIWSVTLKTGPC